MFLYIIALLLLSSVNIGVAQNLVSNSGFEDYEECPTNYTVKSNKWLITNWFMPTRGTADYFNMCTQMQVGIPQNFMGNCFPVDGQAYVGMILMEDPSNDPHFFFNYREYLQTYLTAPLTYKKKYEVVFHYAIATYSTYAINRIGIYFSKDQVKNRKTTKVLHAKPQVSIDSSYIEVEKERWFEVRDTFIANGGEQYLTIGNFFDDSNTCYLKLSTIGLGSYLEKKVNENRIAYYYFDAILVKEIP